MAAAVLIAKANNLLFPAEFINTENNTVFGKLRWTINLLGRLTFNLARRNSILTWKMKYARKLHAVQDHPGLLLREPPQDIITRKLLRIALKIILKTVVLRQIKLRENRYNTREHCLRARLRRGARNNANQSLEARIFCLLFNTLNFLLLEVSEYLIFSFPFLMLLWRFPKRLRHVADQVASTIHHTTQKVCRLFRFLPVFYILYSLERIFYPTTIRRTEHNLYSNTVTFFRGRQCIDETKARITLRILIRGNRIPIIFLKGKLTAGNRINLTLFAKEVRIFYFLETCRRISCRNCLFNCLC